MLRAFGKSWDLVVEKEGDLRKVTVSCQGRTILSETGSPGKTYRVNLTDVARIAPGKKSRDVD